MTNHLRHIRLVLLAISFKKIGDDPETSCANFLVVALFISMKIQQTNHQLQHLNRLTIINYVAMHNYYRVGGIIIHKL